MVRIKALYKGPDTVHDGLELLKGFDYELELKLYTHVIGRLQTVIQIKVLMPQIDEIEYSEISFFEHWTNVTAITPERIAYNEKSILKFGKYAGERLGSVPASYLIFLYDNNYRMPWELEAYIIENEAILRSEASE